MFLIAYYTCTRCDAGFEFIVDMASWYEFTARDSMHIGQRETNEIVASCYTVDPVLLLV